MFRRRSNIFFDYLKKNNILITQSVISINCNPYKRCCQIKLWTKMPTIGTACANRQSLLVRCGQVLGQHITSLILQSPKAIAMCRCCPFLDGHARLNGRLGKFACFCPSFCDFACFFLIFVILNGIRYAQIKEINDKISDKKI